MKIEDETVKALATALNFRQMRQELISSNIANAETPGYKAKKIDFEQALGEAIDVEGTNSLNTSDSRHFAVGGGGFDSLQPTIYEDLTSNLSPDGNTVDRDGEMAELAENRILYDASVQLLNKKIGLLKYAIGSDH